MKHAMNRLVGIKQQRSLSTAISAHLVDALAINTDKHGLIVVGADAANGVLTGVTLQRNTIVTQHLAVITHRHDIQAVLVTAQPKLVRQLVKIAALYIIR